MTTLVRRTLAALMASGIFLSTWAAVTASLDKTQMMLGERVRLIINNTGNGDQQPDITALRQDFEILGTQRGSSLQINNGRMSSQTQFTVLLAPKHAGTLRIAPLQWGGEQSDALELKVGSATDPAKSDANAKTAESQITMSGTLDQNQPYVQSAVVLNLRLNVGVQMTQASLDLQGNSDVLVRQIGKDEQHTESRNGRDYQVIERKYLLIPQRSGAISLKGPVLLAQVPDDAASGSDSDLDSIFGNVFGQAMGRFARPMRTVHLQANAIEMNVKPRPANTEATPWLPAQKLTLEETWTPEQATLQVGEPLTRRLHLSALGLTAGQLPDLSVLMPVPDGIKKYPDQAKTDEGLQGQSLRSSRDQDIALIANAPGHYVLPAFRLAWWDTVNHTQRTIELPARSFDILPATTGTPSGTAAVEPHTASSAGVLKGPATGSATALDNALRPMSAPWMWVSAALVVLWLGTLLLWWSARRRPLPPRDASQAAVAKDTVTGSAPSYSTRDALAALQLACRANDAPAARLHLLEWAHAVWPQLPPRGLNSLAERLKEARYALPVQQLDRACYSADTSWNGAALAQAFSKPPKPSADKKNTPVIPDLYD